MSIKDHKFEDEEITFEEIDDASIYLVVKVELYNGRPSIEDVIHFNIEDLEIMIKEIKEAT